MGSRWEQEWRNIMGSAMHAVEAMSEFHVSKSQQAEACAVWTACHYGPRYTDLITSYNYLKAAQHVHLTA